MREWVHYESAKHVMACLHKPKVLLGNIVHYDTVQDGHYMYMCIQMLCVGFLLTYIKDYRLDDAYGR